MGSLSGDKMELQDLPSDILDTISSFLRYNELLGVRTLCSSLRALCLRRVSQGFSSLPVLIQGELDLLEQRMARAMDNEMKMIYAVCGRYGSSWNYMNKFCGLVLDEFFRVLRTVRSRKEKLEPEITTTLFSLSEMFLLNFTYFTEPYLKAKLKLEVPYGLVIAETLDCAARGEVDSCVVFSEDGRHYRLDATYRLSDLNMEEATARLGELETGEGQLDWLVRALRVHVRWYNLYSPLKEIWGAEDAAERGEGWRPGVAQGLLRDAWGWDGRGLSRRRAAPGGGACLACSVSLVCPAAVLPLPLDFLNDYSPTSSYVVPAPATSHPPVGSVPSDTISLSISYPTSSRDQQQELVFAHSQSYSKYTVLIKTI